MAVRETLLRGGIYWIDWNPARGSEQAGHRPGVVIQNQSGNRAEKYPNTIVVAMSTIGRDIPFHVLVRPSESNGLSQDGYVKCEHILTVAKSRVDTYIGQLDSDDLEAVEHAILRSLGITHV